MSENIIIPIPRHPDDKDLPLSLIRLQLSSGVFEAVIPLQGRKTIEAAIATLELWRPILVREDRKPICEEIALRNLPA